ncbi:triose-phosphate isomerase [Candidatus Marinamargulisbacteria bacterium SCGC AG-410-N11]|nr:triose-phosphate isomerase [Candidatus Marinamargulisbacteria bacterium SCGC AG-410-N11]
MRKYLIAGNWKMNLTVQEGKQFLIDIKDQINSFHNVEILVCPPYTHLDSLSRLAQGSNICIGSQDVSTESNGAYTGEISTDMLSELNCKYCIIGHSERRQYHQESDQLINKKLTKLLATNISPILCVGESLADRESDQTFDVIKRQLTNAFNSINKDTVNIQNLVIAYEPVWAIGTGKVATPFQGQEVHSFIRNLLKETLSDELADHIQILYGGSVNPANIEDLIKQEDIDGALIGGSSLKSDTFLSIIKSSSQVYELSKS